MFAHSKLTIILDNFEIMHNISGILFQISFPRLEVVRFTNSMNLITLKYANYIINQWYEQQSNNQIESTKYTSESRKTISACSDLLGVPTNQRSVILTTSLSVSFDPSIDQILSWILAIKLHRPAKKKTNIWCELGKYHSISFIQ